MNFKEGDLIKYDNGYAATQYAVIRIISTVPHLQLGYGKPFMPIHLYDQDNLTLLAARDTIKQEIKQ